MCAERRLLQSAVRDANKHGIIGDGVVPWIRRKYGNTVTVCRYKADGSFGCSVPCSQCRRVLQNFRLRVRCVQSDGTWFHGYLDDTAAPPSKMTSGQREENRRRQLRNQDRECCAVS